MKNTWVEHKLPVLGAVVRCLYEDADAMPDVAQIASMTGRDPAAVHRSLRAMEDRFIRIPDVSRGADPETYWVEGVTPEARQVVGQWPSAEAVADRIVAALVEAADREPDEGKRSRLRAAAETLGSFGRDLLVSVAANVATKPINF